MCQILTWKPRHVWIQIHRIWSWIHVSIPRLLSGVALRVRLGLSTVVEFRVENENCWEQKVETEGWSFNEGKE